MSVGTIKVQMPAEKAQLLAIMLDKANVTTEEIVQVSLNRWIKLNLDLLSSSEKKKFENVIGK
jgi:hypothetical protein